MIITRHVQKREYKESGKYIWYIMMILPVSLLIISIISGVGEQAVIRLRGGMSVKTLSRVGSYGDEVKQIQTKPRSWGYYKGNVDGIFGEQTKQTVVSFRRRNNLIADGVAGPQTLKAMEISSSSSSSEGSDGGQGQYNSGNVDLLVRVIFAESRGEPYAGRIVVDATILDRISYPSFPDTLAGVIYQPGVFSCLNDDGINVPIADFACKATRDAINGSDPSGGAICYYNPEKSASEWIFSRKVITTIGKHRFAI